MSDDEDDNNKGGEEVEEKEEKPGAKKAAGFQLPKDKPRFEVKKWQAVCLWSWGKTFRDFKHPSPFKIELPITQCIFHSLSRFHS